MQPEEQRFEFESLKEACVGVLEAGRGGWEQEDRKGTSR